MSPHLMSAVLTTIRPDPPTKLHLKRLSALLSSVLRMLISLDQKRSRNKSVFISLGVTGTARVSGARSEWEV
jgi:hypothetical protein